MSILNQKASPDIWKKNITRPIKICQKRAEYNYFKFLIKGLLGNYELSKTGTVLPVQRLLSHEI